MIRIGTALLRTFGSGPSIETLIGDLTEEYREGRSSIWFWWQVIVAIPTTFIREVWTHKLVTFRAIAAGWILLTGFGWVVRRLSPWINAAFEVYLPRHEPYYAAASPFINGVRVGNPEIIQVDWYRVVAMPFVQIVLLALTFLATGWVVGRFHRKHRNAAVFSFMLSFLVYTFVSIAWRMMFPAPELGFLTVWGLEAVWWNTWAVTFGVSLITLMLGGLAVGDGRKTDSLATG